VPADEEVEHRVVPGCRRHRELAAEPHHALRASRVGSAGGALTFAA
jgi:hypothetical protein